MISVSDDPIFAFGTRVRNFRAFKQYAGASVIRMAPNNPEKMANRVVPDRRSFKQRKQSANRL